MKLSEIKKKLKHKDKLVIVGTANTWDKAPYDSDEFDFWGLNGLHAFTDQVGITKKFTLWFQIHSKNNVFNQKQHLAWLKQCPIPVFMQDHYEEIPNSIKLPFEELSQKYRNYFESSFAYMFTLAMEMGYEEIQIYGVHLTAESEYTYQKPNAEYFLGIAEGRGINIVIPPEADLLSPGVTYGYDEKTGLYEKIDHEIEKLKQSKETLENQKRKIELMIAKYEGALDRDKYYRRIL